MTTIKKAETFEDATILGYTRSGKRRESYSVPVSNKEINPATIYKNFRKDSEYKFWLVGIPEAEIFTSSLPRLPRQTIRLFLHKVNELGPPGSSKWRNVHSIEKAKAKSHDKTFLGTVASMTFDVIAGFWYRANLPLKDEASCRRDILSLHSDWQSLKKHRNRVGKCDVASRIAFSNKLDRLLDLTPPYWQNIVRKTRATEVALKT